MNSSFIYQKIIIIYVDVIDMYVDRVVASIPGFGVSTQG